MKVLIAGAGLGGLTLAQSLRNHGVDVAVFERDSSPWDRSQGYRLHLDADALNAAREVLPDDLHAVFEATSHHTTPFTTILGTDLSIIKQLPTATEHDRGVWPDQVEPTHANVDRATLRQILLAGTHDTVEYGKALLHYESTGDGVVAHFADGSTARGDVLVGADGIRSAVRRQRAPHADTVDAGITAIYGRLPATSAGPLVPAPVTDDIFTIASDERKVFLGLGSVRFPMRPADAAAAFAPEVALRDQDDYVVCIVGGRHEYFPNDGALRACSGEELQRIAVDTLRDWPEPARTVVGSGDPASFFVVEMYTSVPCTLDAPSNVTLIGDAIHAMTPTLGRGANVAMRDGALLGRALDEVARGESTLSTAMATYENAMLGYGFAVVRNAATIGEQRMGQNPLP